MNVFEKVYETIFPNFTSSYLPIPLQMKTNIQGSFDQVRKALDLREKLLIRQLQVLEKQANQFTKEIEFNPENEVGLLHLIRVFGKFNVQLNVCSDFLASEDYICPQDDHVLINKRLIEVEEENAPDVQHDSEEGRRRAALHLAMVDDNANHINESLINLILNESKELIGKSKCSQKRTCPKTNNNNNIINKEGRHGNKTLPNGGTNAEDTPASRSVNPAPSTHAKPSKRAIEAASTTSSTSALPKKKFSSSLKTVSNLNPAVPSGAPNLRRPTAIPSTTITTDYDVQAVTCDFYNRLINENKLLKPICRRSTATPSPGYTYNRKSHAEYRPATPSSTDTSSTSFKEFCTEFERKLVDNWEGGCDGLPVDSNGNISTTAANEDRPKQIQLWLKQIIHEPELEPMQNTELLEFSGIASP